jgi:hypothetical protein
MNNKQKDIQQQDMGDNITRLFNRAIVEAQKENHKLGLPNVFWRNGRVIYEYPNGVITTERINK